MEGHVANWLKRRQMNVSSWVAKISAIRASVHVHVGLVVCDEHLVTAQAKGICERGERRAPHLRGAEEGTEPAQS